MFLKISKPLVSVAWLYNHLEDKNLIILDGTIKKVTANSTDIEEKLQIRNALYFNLKNVFSDQKAPFPNTVLSPKEFEDKAQEIGVNHDSMIVCYDDLGIYSSPRVRWIFQLMGLKNIAVLDGGLPAWKANNYPVEKPKSHQPKKGNFKVDYKPEKLKKTQDVLNSIENKSISIVDARSKGRFLGTEPEPRNDVKSGHIPNSISLPYTEIIENGMMKSEDELKRIFNNYQKKEQIIFTCGSGITAAILALGAEISGLNNFSVYDGSWTEWGSTTNLPIAL